MEFTDEQKQARSVIQSMFSAAPLRETTAGEMETYLLLENDRLKIYIYSDGEVNIKTQVRDMMFELTDFESAIALLDAVLVALGEIKIAD